jgi:hypothetical protein
MDEIKKIINDSYNDYIGLTNIDMKKIYAKQISRTASGFIKNSGSDLHDWKEQFKKIEKSLQERKALVEGWKSEKTI